LKAVTTYLARMLIVSGLELDFNRSYFTLLSSLRKHDRSVRLVVSHARLLKKITAFYTDTLPCYAAVFRFRHLISNLHNLCTGVFLSASEPVYRTSEQFS